jgi:hypothetical protein
MSNAQMCKILMLMTKIQWFLLLDLKSQLIDDALYRESLACLNVYDFSSTVMKRLKVRAENTDDELFMLEYNSAIKASAEESKI